MVPLYQSLLLIDPFVWLFVFLFCFVTVCCFLFVWILWCDPVFVSIINNQVLRKIKIMVENDVKNWAYISLR